MTEATANREIIRTLEWGARSFRISIHLPRELEQLASTEEALRKGYVPFAQPRGWPIGVSRWESEPRSERRGDYTSTADLHLEELDIPMGAEGYVASGIAWEN